MKLILLETLGGQYLCEEENLNITGDRNFFDIEVDNLYNFSAQPDGSNKMMIYINAMKSHPYKIERIKFPTHSTLLTYLNEDSPITKDYQTKKTSGLITEIPQDVKKIILKG
jgi:hypothetical protein